MKDILLIGGGGHCKSVIDTILAGNQFHIVGILDKGKKVGTSVSDIAVIGDDDAFESYYNKGIKHGFITLGSIGDPKVRIDLYKKMTEIGFDFPVIIDKTAIVSRNVSIEEGTFVGKRVVINSNVFIGKNCIINSGAVIEHDCRIEEFVHIAPGAILSGGVHIRENTHIGTNSTIIQNISIGSNTMIGAGSVVVKDIQQNMQAFGNPCREVKPCQGFL
jgi:sugar O-acyltransferase (sialic acid O-acetyltransferase NeuD family)